MTNDDHTDLTAGKDIPPWLQPVPEGEDEAAEAASRRRRLILTTTAAVVVIGLFVAVILYLYEGSDPVSPRHIAAPTQTVRERPADVGGLQVAHQDKEVFNQVDGGSHRAEVELSAQPEEPLKELPQNQPEESTVDVESVDTETVNAAERLETAPSTEQVTVPEQTVEASAEVSPGTDDTSVISPQAYRVQLGAYGSEQSASRAWRLVKGKFPTQLSEKSAEYEAVQSGDRTLYRLRVGPLDTRAEADQVCLALRAGQQACIVVNP